MWQADVVAMMTQHATVRSKTTWHDDMVVMLIWHNECGSL